MSQSVIKLSEQKMKDMKEYYQNHLATPPAGARFSVKINGCTITAYKSGKVLFQGKKHQEEASKWEKVNLSKKETKKQATVPSAILNDSHIGSDESGTGDYFGPITAASCYVTKEQIEQLKTLGIQDSKKISDLKAIELSQKMVELGIPYSLLTISNEKYNQLKENNWTSDKMKAMLHHHSHLLLIDKLAGQPYAGIVVDDFCTPEWYEKYIRSENESLIEGTYFTTEAELHSIAVAAASVIARAKFLQEMDRLSELVGFALLKGASKEVDKQAAKVMQKDPSLLNKVAKVSFVTTKKAKQYL